jgi:peptidoglycan/LPS O-acetylase OafA/YrhL
LVQALHLFPTAPMNTVSWSLSTEWWMYLLFPLLMPLVAGGRVGRAVGLLGVAAGYGLVKYWLVPAYGMHLWRHQTATLNTINDFAFVRCMMGFVLGMITCRWFQLGAGRRWLGRDAGFVIVVAALLLSLHFDLNELVPVALFPFLILATAYNESAAGRLLASRPAQRLGDWSFSIYMVHMPLFFTYRGLAPLLGLPVPQGLFTAKPVYAVGWIGFALFLAATLATAALCYRWLEVPARNYLNGRRAARKEPVSGSFV